MSKRLSKAQIRRMSIEQLQQILRDDLFASEEDEMDSNTIAFITKTLARKSEEEQPDCFPDVDEQWESFNKNYRPTSEEASSLYAVITYEDESDKNIKEEDAKTGKFSAKKSKRRIRVMASAAADFSSCLPGELQRMPRGITFGRDLRRGQRRPSVFFPGRLQNLRQRWLFLKSLYLWRRKWKITEFRLQCFQAISPRDMKS